MDADDAEADVAAAADALAARPAGADDDARFTVDGAEDHELLWFATQEIPAPRSAEPRGSDPLRPC